MAETRHATPERPAAGTDGDEAPGRRPVMAWVAVALLLAFLYLVRGVLMPFLAGLALAYLLDPLADRLEAWRVPRTLAAAIVLFFFFLLFVGLAAALWPLFHAQLLGLIGFLPDLIDGIRKLYSDELTRLAASLGVSLDATAEGFASSALAELSQSGTHLIQQVFSRGLAIINLFSLLLITPVVAFYLLRDYDRLVAAVVRLLPDSRRATITALGREIDGALAGFVRGQLLVMAADAVLYAAGWMAVGLPYALILGLLAGLLAIVPFVGPLFSVLLALAIAVTHWGGDLLALLPVAGVWVAVQAIEGAVLSPRLLGREVGLHPVWVLFAVFAGGEIAGLTGVFLAVPIAAVVSVLVRHFYGYLTQDRRMAGASGSTGGAGQEERGVTQ